MNSLERVRIALQRGQPDRVPIAEFLIDLKVARAAAPGARDAADCMDRLDMDAVGCGPNWRTGPKAADGSYTDEWGVRYRLGAEALAHPVAGPVATLADARAYQPPDPDAPWRLDTLRDLVRRYQGRRAIIAPCLAPTIAPPLCGPPTSPAWRACWRPFSWRPTWPTPSWTRC